MTFVNITCFHPFPHAMPLPPYLTSAASSRAHHALLVRLDEAASPQEEAAIILEEVERCRGVLAKNPKSVRDRSRSLTLVSSVPDSNHTSSLLQHYAYSSRPRICIGTCIAVG